MCQADICCAIEYLIVGGVEDSIIYKVINQMEKDNFKKVNPLDLIDISMHQRHNGEYTFYDEKKK